MVKNPIPTRDRIIDAAAKLFYVEGIRRVAAPIILTGSLPTGSGTSIAAAGQAAVTERTDATADLRRHENTLADRDGGPPSLRSGD
jgi:hypothetical protein